MRVLYLIQDAGFGAPQAHVSNLVRGLLEQQDSAVAAGETGFLTDNIRQLAVPCHVLRNFSSKMSPATTLRGMVEVARLIRWTRADLVHAHGSNAGLIGRLAARIVGVPSVYTAHSSSPAKTGLCSPFVELAIERIAGRFGAALITLSDDTRRCARGLRLAPEERLVTICDGLPDTPHRATPDLGRVPKVITIARGNEPDDLRCLLRFLATTSIPAHANLVASNAGAPAVRAAALSLGISSRIDLLDFLTDRARLLSQANVFVQPRGDDSAFHNIVEAMRAGLPVIALNVGGAPDAVTEGLTGFLVEPGDEATFCSRLEALLHDPALRRRMGNEGRKRYETEFSLKLMLDRTLEVYRKAVFGAEPRSRSALQPHGQAWSAHTFPRRGDRVS